MLKQLKARQSRHKYNGQVEDMAIVLAVITVATVAVFTALSGGIQGAISNLTGILAM